jgi:glutamine synthetase
METRPYMFVRLLWVDCAGIHRCRVIPRSRLDDVVQDGVGLAYACMFLPCWGDVPPSEEPAAAPVGECRLIPEVETFTTLPWHPNEAMVMVNMVCEESRLPWECCPRTALRKVLDLLLQETGFHIACGFECEFNLLKDEVSGPLPVDDSVYCQTSSFNDYSHVLGEMCLALEKMGQTVEQVHAESAHGQFEIATRFEIGLKSADAQVARKEAIRAVARKHNLRASFLPKPFKDQAGNGCHLHFSLRQGNEYGLVDQCRSHGLSQLGEAFAAGILLHLPAVMVFSAGNPNSFHRFLPSSWSGAYQCWGVNNREAPLRLVGFANNGSRMNFEYKACDGTANPYLVLAAIVVAGLDGVRKNICLPKPIQVDPQRLAQQGSDVTRLPGSLNDALVALHNDHDFITLFNEAVGSETLLRAHMAVKLSESDYFNGLSFEEEVGMLYRRF